MFNRALQVKMVKTANVEDNTRPHIHEESFADKLWETKFIAKDIILDVGKVVVAYVVLDTFRQVLITLAEQK